MQYEILHRDAFPVVSCKLRRGEAINAESDAMIYMSSTVDVEGHMDRSLSGIAGALARKFLTGESFFMQRMVATRGDGEVMFAHTLPGGIEDVELDGSYGMVIQKGGFLASTEGVDISTKVQNIAQGLFSSEGFFLLKATGRGTVFISSYGAIHPINLEAGEEVVIDNGHLVAWPDYMEYKIDKASNGWLSSFTSGECVVCRFRGPGTVLIQTRNPEGFESWIKSIVPMQSNR